jgi:hypothetical protein
MRSLRVLGPAFAAAALVGSAAGAGVSIPGGPAPKALVGTYRTTLSRADLAKAANPAHIPTFKWDLVIINSPYLHYPRALGLRPTGQGGDTVPFGVKGNRIYLQCLVEGAPAPGFGTYAFTLRGKSLRLRLLREPCKERDLRNRIAILTSKPWVKVR